MQRHSQLSVLALDAQCICSHINLQNKDKPHMTTQVNQQEHCHCGTQNGSLDPNPILEALLSLHSDKMEYSAFRHMLCLARLNSSDKHSYQKKSVVNSTGSLREARACDPHQADWCGAKVSKRPYNPKKTRIVCLGCQDRMQTHPAKAALIDGSRGVPSLTAGQAHVHCATPYT